MDDVLSPDVAQATRWLGGLATRVRYADLPAPARRIVLHCIVDWYAVTLAAAGHPALAPLLDDAGREGGRPLATAVGMAEKLGLYPAALINGTTAHFLDYDDVNLAITGHPTAVVYSALLPLAQYRRSSGPEVLDAFVAGYETACRLGRWLGDSHYEHGYHATATAGVVAAAAACARLMRLDADRMACALGLAATQACGLKAQFGTLGKPLHAGLAARNGLMAACLAAGGYDGSLGVLEAVQGYAATLSPAPDFAAAAAEPAGGWHLYGRLFKYHAACYGTHAGIECARALRAGGLDPATVSAVRVVAHVSGRNMCNIAAPLSANEARFSLRLNIAFALLGIDTGDIHAYADERLRHPDVISLRDRIEVDFSDDMQMMEASIEVALLDGRTLQVRKDAGLPEQDVPVEENRIRAKFLSLAAPVLGAGAAQGLLERLFAFAGLPDLDCVADVLAAPGGARA
ncbi:MAG TPA: MmgE/PrpD family protein [Bordetella sp.]